MLYSSVHAAMETKKNVKFYLSIKIFHLAYFSLSKFQLVSSNDLTYDVYSQTAKTVFSHLKLVIWQKQIKRYIFLRLGSNLNFWCFLAFKPMKFMSA